MGDGHGEWKGPFAPRRSASHTRYMAADVGGVADHQCNTRCGTMGSACKCVCAQRGPSERSGSLLGASSGHRPLGSNRIRPVGCFFSWAPPGLQLRPLPHLPAKTIPHLPAGKHHQAAYLVWFHHRAGLPRDGVVKVAEPNGYG